MSTTALEQQLEDANDISEVVSVMTSTGAYTRDQSHFSSTAASLFKKSDGAQTREEEVADILDRVDDRLEHEQSNEGLIHDDEFKLHVNPSLVIIICTNILMQVCVCEFMADSDTSN